MSHTRNCNSITGTASAAGGGSVARVEVSVDGGATYSAATGTTSWSFNWTPTTPGQASIKSRAVDDSGNQQNPPAEITVTVALLIRVPSDRPTIQSAIDVAIDGDTALVAPGTYPEHINFRGKAITVTSDSGPQDTIIDAGNLTPVVFFISGEGRDSTLNGFTLQNGRVFDSIDVNRGGGLLIKSSSPTITNNVIRNNHACRGAGIEIDAGSPLIQRERSDAEKIFRRWQIGACRLRVGRECEDKHECDQSDSSQFHIHPFLYSFGA